ncbi:hypothetical protein CJ467_03155 [Bacillus velezensis]|nr:hypothetical protein CJ467_03155 [Bacillus velezensis]
MISSWLIRLLFCIRKTEYLVCMINATKVRKTFTIQEMTHAAANEISYMTGNTVSKAIILPSIIKK